MLLLRWVVNVDSCTFFIPVLCFFSPKKTLASPSQLQFLVVPVRGNFIVLITVFSTDVAQNGFLIYTFGTRG